MKRIKNYFIILLGFLILASCSTKKEEVSISFAVWGSADEIPQITSWLNKFEEKNKGVKVKLIHIGRAPDYSRKVLTMCAGGTPPDVMMVDNLETANIYLFAEKGLLYCLDEFIKNKENEEWISDINKIALEAFKWKGHYYGIPREINSFIMYYNKDLFDKEKVPYPDESWNWEKTIEIAKKITKEEGNRVIQYGLLEVPFLLCCASYGSKLFNDKGEFVFGKDNEEEAISLIIDAIKEKATPSPITGASFGWATEGFLTGRVGMYISGPWECRKFIEAKVKFKWDMALIPRGPKGRFIIPMVCGYAISKNAKNKEMCIRLIQHLTSWETLKDFSYSGRSFPASKKAVKMWYLKDVRYKDIKNKSVPEESLKFATRLVKYPYMQELNAILRRNIEKILLQKINIKEGLELIQKEYKEKLAKMEEQKWKR